MLARLGEQSALDHEHAVQRQRMELGRRGFMTGLPAVTSSLQRQRLHVVKRLSRLRHHTAAARIFKSLRSTASR